LSDDAPLIAATLAGDSAAFGQLVGLYQDRLYNSLLRVVGSAEDAGDIVQDAFVQAFVKLDTFRGSSAFTPGCIALRSTWP
jgi:RNA polymerase sigma-70 factor (ECF subfamily)